MPGAEETEAKAPAEGRRTVSTMMKALVIGVSNPTGLALLRTLSAGGVDLHAADSNRNSPGMALVKRWHRLVLPPTLGLETIDAIIRHCFKKRIQVVIPATEEHLNLLSEYEDEFEQRAIRIMTPSERTKQVCVDRVQLFEAMQQASIPAPKFAIINEELDLTGWTFPVILRPRGPEGEQEQRLISSVADLENVPKDSTFVIEEPLFGEIAFVDVMASQGGDVLAAVPRSEFRDKDDRPVAVTRHDERLQVYGRRAAEAAGVRFAASIELRRAPNGPWKVSGLIPRCTGASMLTAKSGVNIPLLCLKEVLGEPIHRQELRFKEVGMVRAPANAIKVRKRKSKSRTAASTSA